MSEQTHDPLADLQAAIELVAKASRVIIVNPEHEEAARTAAAASPFPGLIEVHAEAACPVDRVYLIPTWIAVESDGA